MTLHTVLEDPACIDLQLETGRVPVYLPLLHLSEPWNARAARDQLCKRIWSCADPEREILRLLDGLDWRPHLSGAVAATLLPSPRVVAALWSAHDAGSWVAPQLGAVASLVDEDFDQRAIARVVRLPRIDRDAWMLRAEEEGRGSELPPAARDAKALTNLLTLLSRRPGLKLWSKAQRARPEVSGLYTPAILLENQDQLSSQWLDRWHKL